VVCIIIRHMMSDVKGHMKIWVGHLTSDIKYTGGMTAPDPGEVAVTLPAFHDAAKRARSPMLGVTIVDELVEAIVSGRLTPGDTLPPEGPLSDQFGVSRTTIRESVKRVEEKGLITIDRGRGTRVLPEASWNLLDSVVLGALIKHDDSRGVLDELSVVRAQLESVMAAEAARIRDDDQLARLGAALQRMRDTAHDLTAFREADVEFHAIVMATSGNRLAQGIAHILLERALESWRYHGVDRPAHVALTVGEHEAVYDAVAHQDAVRARDAMNMHITDSWRRRRVQDHSGGGTASG
jgi:DNA-binding FadR family transcriptional regulator